MGFCAVGFKGSPCVGRPCRHQTHARAFEDVICGQFLASRSNKFVGPPSKIFDPQKYGHGEPVLPAGQRRAPQPRAGSIAFSPPNRAWHQLLDIHAHGLSMASTSLKQNLRVDAATVLPRRVSARRHRRCVPRLLRYPLVLWAPDGHVALCHVLALVRPASRRIGPSRSYSRVFAASKPNTLVWVCIRPAAPAAPTQPPSVLP